MITSPRVPGGLHRLEALIGPAPAVGLRSVNQLLGLLNAADGYGDRAGVAELLRRHTYGHAPPAVGAPRRVVVAGESAVIGLQHIPAQPRARWWVRYDWLGTYPSFHTLMRALEDARFRPGAVEDLGGGRFAATQSWWATRRYDSCGNWTDDRDTTIVRLLFVPSGGGVAIDVGSRAFDDDHDTDGCPQGDALLERCGVSPEDVSGPCEDYACVLDTDGIHVLEELFG